MKAYHLQKFFPIRKKSDCLELKTHPIHLYAFEPKKYFPPFPSPYRFSKFKKLTQLSITRFKKNKVCVIKKSTANKMRSQPNSNLLAQKLPQFTKCLQLIDDRNAAKEGSILKGSLKIGKRRALVVNPKHKFTIKMFRTAIQKWSSLHKIPFFKQKVRDNLKIHKVGYREVGINYDDNRF